MGEVDLSESVLARLAALEQRQTDFAGWLRSIEDRVASLELPPMARLSQAIDSAIRKLPPEVVRVRYTIGCDHDGDPAIFFRILLPNLPDKEMFVLARTVEAAVEFQGLAGGAGRGRSLCLFQLPYPVRTGETK